MQIERDQRITLLIVVGLVALFAVGLWVPHRMRTGRLQARVERARAALGVDTRAGVNLPDLAREVAELERSLIKSEQHVPAEAQMGSLLRRLSRELEGLQVSGQELQTQALQEGGNYSVIPVTVRFRGSFAAAMRFLQRTQELERLVRVTRLEIGYGAGEPDGGLEVRMELAAFFAPPSAEGGKS